MPTVAPNTPKFAEPHFGVVKRTLIKHTQICTLTPGQGPTTQEKTNPSPFIVKTALLTYSNRAVQIWADLGLDDPAELSHLIIKWFFGAHSCTRVRGLLVALHVWHYTCRSRLPQNPGVFQV